MSQIETLRVGNVLTMCYRQLDARIGTQCGGNINPIDTIGIVS